MESPKYSRVLGIAAMGSLAAACAPPPVAPASAMLLVTASEQASPDVVATFAEFHRARGMIYVDSRTVWPDHVRLGGDALGLRQQAYIWNPSSANQWKIGLFRGGVTYWAFPASEAEVVARAYDLCTQIEAIGTGVSVRSIRGSAVQASEIDGVGCTALEAS